MLKLRDKDLSCFKMWFDPYICQFIKNPVSELRYGIRLYFPKQRFCFVKTQSVLSTGANFLEKNDTFNIALIF